MSTGTFALVIIERLLFKSQLTSTVNTLTSCNTLPNKVRTVSCVLYVKSMYYTIILNSRFKLIFLSV